MLCSPACVDIVVLIFHKLYYPKGSTGDFVGEALLLWLRLAARQKVGTFQPPSQIRLGRGEESWLSHQK